MMADKKRYGVVAAVPCGKVTMSKRKTVITLLCANLGVSLLLCLSTACSRQEKPKAVEKKPLTIETAPTPVPSTGMVKIIRKIDTNSPHYRPPEPSTSTPERQKRLRDRQVAFQKKAIAEEIPKIEKQIDELSDQLQAVESLARLSNSAVVASARTLEMAQSAYDQARYALPGMAELKRDRDAAKARLTELKNQTVPQMGGASAPEERRAKALAAAQDEIHRLTQKMYETEMAGRTNSMALQQSVSAFRASESDYQASLMALPEYKDLAAKQNEMMMAHEDMLETQKTLGQEEK